MSITAESTISAFKQARSFLKQDIKDDVESIRQQKRQIRDLQREGSSFSAGCQSSLARSRRYARARYIVYGLIRGKTWDQIEQNHPEGDASLKGDITNIWRSVVVRCEGQLDTPEALQSWLMR